MIVFLGVTCSFSLEVGGDEGTKALSVGLLFVRGSSSLSSDGEDVGMTLRFRRFDGGPMTAAVAKDLSYVTSNPRRGNERFAATSFHH